MATSQFWHLEKFNPNFSSSSFVIRVFLVRLWFIVPSLVFFYLNKVLLSGFQSKSSFVRGQNKLKSQLSAKFVIYQWTVASNFDPFSATSPRSQSRMRQIAVLM